MKNKVYLGFLILFVIFQTPLLRVHAAEFDYKSAEFKAVASQFRCTCGCGQDHFECDPNTCNETKEFKQDLVDMMKKGWDKDKIRDYYVNIYGEEILTAPEKSGFSLAAWTLPFAAIGIAGAGLFFVIRKWVKRKAPDETNETVQDIEEEVEGEILSSLIDEERKKYL
ncbi:cytochrome c-type biogenesis protein [Neobacillus dielmonensis]|uniref:cytochrome c-type biogenesis protein n=1 Tax=Neobacillus dielmonensis TaxID=1347369 RepID=UPI0005A9BD7C|nr:cytochrome c-type biogenesis protein [Neobacillus dielmonensis]